MQDIFRRFDQRFKNDEIHVISDVDCNIPALQTLKIVLFIYRKWFFFASY